MITKEEMVIKLTALAQSLPGEIVCFSFNPPPELGDERSLNKFRLRAKVMIALLHLLSENTAAAFWLDYDRRYHFHGIVVADWVAEWEPLDAVRMIYEKAFPTAGKDVKKAVRPWDLEGWIRYCAGHMMRNDRPLEARMMTCGKLDAAWDVIAQRRRISYRRPPKTFSQRYPAPRYANMTEQPIRECVWCGRALQGKPGREPRSHKKTCSARCRQALHRHPTATLKCSSQTQ